MPKPAGLRSTPLISRQNRALLAAALMALGSGTGTPQLRAQVDIASIRTRADQGDVEAMNALGNAYANGQGVPQNLAEAMRMYQRAAERGLAAAQFNLGMMHELGRGVSADMATAFKHYLKAAEQGFAPAQFNVGNMYANGIGVRQDYFEAALWFRQAADRKVPEAQYNLALAYELGRGVAKDEAAAQRWYRDAAAQRYSRAQYNLALMLEEGRGSAPDPAAAVEYYRAAATQNFAPAQNNLGILLAEGRGAAADLVEAYMWLALAVENGAKPVGRDIVAQQLSPQQLASANAAVVRMRAQLGLREGPPAAATVAANAPAARSGAPVAAAPAPPGGPPPEVAALNTRVIAAETELEKLRAENSRLAQSAEGLTREKTTLEQRLAAASTAVESARAENARLSDANRAATANAPRTSAAEQQLRTQLQEVSREIAALRVENAEAKKRAEELASRLAKAGSAPTEPAASPGGALAPKAGATLQDLAAGDPRIAKLIADNARLNDDVKRSTVELTRLGRELRMLQERAGAGAGGKTAAQDSGRTAEPTRELAEARAANETLTARLSQLEQRATRAEESLTESTKHREALAAEKVALERRVAELAAKPAGDPELAKAMRTQLGEALDDLEKARKTNEELKAQVVAAQRAEAAQKESVAQLQTTAAKGSDEVRGELERLRAALADAQTKLSASNREQAAGGAAAQKLRDATEQLEVVSAERDRLLQAQAALGPARQSLADAAKQREALVAEKAAVEKRLAEARAEIAAQQTAAARLEDANARLGARFDEVVAERDRLATAAQGTSGERETAANLNRELEAARRATAELASKNDSLLKDLEVAKQSAAAALAAQAAAAKAGPSEATKLEMQTLQNQVRGLETQLEEDRKISAREIAALAAQLQNARETSRSLSEANRSLLQARGSDDSAAKAQVEQATTQLRAAQTELERLRGAAQERDTLRAQVEEIAGRAAAAERQIAQWKQMADTSRAEAEKARSELAGLQGRLGETERAATEHGSTVAELTGLNEKLNSEKSALEKQLSQARQAADAARAEVTDLRGKVAQGDRALQAQLEMLNDASATNERGQNQVKELTAQVAALRAENTRLASAGETSATVRAELDDVKARLAESRKAAEQHGATVAELTAANEKLGADVKALQGQLEGMRAENTRLAQSDAALRNAEQRAANLGAAAAQLATAQRDLQSARSEIARLSETVQALDRDRTARVTALQQENAAIAARLRQAQGTLDSIASAARLMNTGAGGGANSITSAPTTPASAPTPAPGSTSPGIVPAPRIHSVVEGDSLTRISVRYYGTGNRWQDIYEANRETLKGENALKPGQRLRIP